MLKVAIVMAFVTHRSLSKCLGKLFKLTASTLFLHSKISTHARNDHESITCAANASARTFFLLFPVVHLFLLLLLDDNAADMTVYFRGGYDDGRICLFCFLLQKHLSVASEIKADFKMVNQMGAAEQAPSYTRRNCEHHAVS